MKIVIHGCYRNKNFGDILMLNLISAHIKKELGLVPVCPWVRRSQKIGLEPKRGHGWVDVLTADVALFGGGGYLVNEAQQKLWKWRYSLPAKIWQLKNVPYIIVGAGVGPDLSGRGISRVKTIVNGAAEVYVRDEESRTLLISKGIDGNSIQVTCDIAIIISLDHIPQWAKEQANLDLRQYYSKKRLLGLHFPDLKGPRSFSLSYPFHGRAIHPRLIEIVKQVSEGLNEDNNIVPIWINSGWSQKFDKSLREVCKKYLPNSVFLKFRNHWVTAAIISQLTAIITSKLHAGIIAWALGVPCCAYATHGKTQRFYRQIGREAFVCDVNNDVKIIKNWTEIFVKDYERFKQENNNARILLKKKSQENMQIITEWLKKKIDHKLIVKKDDNN